MWQCKDYQHPGKHGNNISHDISFRASAQRFRLAVWRVGITHDDHPQEQTAHTCNQRDVPPNPLHLVLGAAQTFRTDNACKTRLLSHGAIYYDHTLSTSAHLANLHPRQQIVGGSVLSVLV
jgi:hypothetical protein